MSAPTATVDTSVVIDAIEHTDPAAVALFERVSEALGIGGVGEGAQLHAVGYGARSNVFGRGHGRE